MSFLVCLTPPNYSNLSFEPQDQGMSSLDTNPLVCLYNDKWYHLGNSYFSKNQYNTKYKCM